MRSDYEKPDTIVSLSATEEVDEFIDQNIQINSNKQMRQEYLNLWTLRFKDSTQESKFCQLREDMFRSNMLCVFVVWIFIVMCQTIIILRCTVLIICLAVCTLLLTAGCILVMAEEFPGLPSFMQKSSATLVHHRNRRTIFVCCVIILMSATSTIGLVFCPITEETYLSRINNTDDIPLNVFSDNKQQVISNLLIQNSISINAHFNVYNNHSSSPSKTIADNYTYGFLNNNNNSNDFIIDNLSYLLETQFLSQNDSQNITNHTIPPADVCKSCSNPEYVVFTWVLCLIALATALKLYYLVKTFMAIVMVSCFTVLILVPFNNVFEFSDKKSDSNDYTSGTMPLSAQMIILIMIFLAMVTYHARLVEVTSRLDFIWKEQAEKELLNMKSNRTLNNLLIKVRI